MSPPLGSGGAFGRRAKPALHACLDGVRDPTHGVNDCLDGVSDPTHGVNDCLTWGCDPALGVSDCLR